MPFRQIATLLVVCIVIIGAGLIVLSWGNGDDATDATGSSTTTTIEPTTASTSTTSTTSVPSTPVTVPAICTTDVDEETTTTQPPTDTTAGDESEVDETLVATLGPGSTISTVGLDTVTFGLTLLQAEEAAGTTMTPCGPVSSCYRVSPLEAPEGISFLVHEGTIERVDIVDGPITTRSGAGIGTTGDRLVELFGDSLERRVIDTDTVDLIFVPSDETDAEFRVAFTVVDGIVETFRSGRLPMVLDADPCAA